MISATKRGGSILAVTVLALCAATLAPTALAQYRAKNFGLRFPGRTDAGRWEGTWYYLNRSEKWGLWIREQEGVPELKLRHLNVDKAESFTTDWTTTMDYVHEGRIGEFRISFTERDENIIVGDWHWKLGKEGVDDLVRIETARITMYRTGDGRQIVLKFDDFERVYKKGDDNALRFDPPVAWTFHKASRREARWAELPF
jgi:hypothetical protein